MRIAHAASIDWAGVSRHRDTTIVFKRLLTGPAGTPDNFELSLVRMDGRYTTPRHRHNYDQIRVPLEGVLNYAPGKDLHPGSIGYFPEGTPYGPQDVPAGGVSMALQFGGDSGQGMLTYDQLGAASKALSEVGVFEKGVYTRVMPDGSKINLDGFEAVWQQATGAPLVYPAARYEEPVVMKADAFAWGAAGKGVARRHLGTFGERGLSIEQVKLDRGQTVLGAAHRLLGFVRAGAGQLGGQALAAHDGFEILAGESAVMSGGLEVILMTLPSAARAGASAAA